MARASYRRSRTRASIVCFGSKSIANQKISLGAYWSLVQDANRGQVRRKIVIYALIAGGDAHIGAKIGII